MPSKAKKKQTKNKTNSTIIEIELLLEGQFIQEIDWKKNWKKMFGRFVGVGHFSNKDFKKQKQTKNFVFVQRSYF